MRRRVVACFHHPWWRWRSAQCVSECLSWPMPPSLQCEEAEQVEELSMDEIKEMSAIDYYDREFDSRDGIGVMKGWAHAWVSNTDLPPGSIPDGSRNTPGTQRIFTTAAASRRTRLPPCLQSSAALLSPTLALFLRLEPYPRRPLTSVWAMRAIILMRFHLLCHSSEEEACSDDLTQRHLLIVVRQLHPRGPCGCRRRGDGVVLEGMISLRAQALYMK